MIPLFFFFKERKKSTGGKSRVISKGENHTSITYQTKMEKKCMKSEKQICFIHPHTGGNKQLLPYDGKELFYFRLFILN